jgi:hypothetical protein
MFYATPIMTVATQPLKPKRPPKIPKNMGERLLEARDRAAAKIPKKIGIVCQQIHHCV